jgi:hypothetical protein
MATVRFVLHHSVRSLFTFIYRKTFMSEQMSVSHYSLHRKRIPRQGDRKVWTAFIKSLGALGAMGRMPTAFYSTEDKMRLVLVR